MVVSRVFFTIYIDVQKVTVLIVLFATELFAVLKLTLECVSVGVVKLARAVFGAIAPLSLIAFARLVIVVRAPTLS